MCVVCVVCVVSAVGVVGVVGVKVRVGGGGRGWGGSDQCTCPVL